MPEADQITSEQHEAPVDTGSQPTDWKSSLPDEIRGKFDKFDDVGSLATSYDQLERMVGNSIRPPSEEAGAEDWNKFRSKVMEKDPALLALPDDPESELWNEVYAKLGRPEEPTGYAAPELEGLQIPEERLSFLQNAAYEAGIGGKQFEKVIGKVLEADAQMLQQQEEQRQEGLKSLNSEWGMAYDSKVERAGKVAEATGAPKELLDAVQNGSANAATLKWLDSLADSLGSEDAVVSQQFANGSNAMTPDEAMSRADEIFAKIQNMSPSDPQYKGLVKRRADYIGIANRK